MKTVPHSPFPVNRHIAARTAGVALIIVLGFLVLITGLVVAFLSSVTTELSDARIYSGEVTTKQLGDSAVQIVQGAISLATSQGGNIAWASQPGMVRTYGTSGNTASSSPLAYYKLYSSDNMILTSKFTTPFANDTDANWFSEPAHFVDLNAPARGRYPIVDPTAAAAPVGQGLVDGFTITTPPGTSTNPAPMPVRWMYVLRDGTLTTPTYAAGKTTTATFSTRAPTAANPIVGRIAFWTDDETAKVNINTASEGTFWDTPIADTYGSTTGYPPSNEWDLACYIGANKEYQRYPGHPATTCLSPVLGSTIFGSTYKTLLTSATASQRAQFVQAMTNIAPRVTDTSGSSVSTMGGTQLATGALAPDSDRLYSTVDELLFKNAGSPRTVNQTALTASQLNKLKFFLTANSKAPELNLFNQPRVAIWPINSSTTYQTTFDKTLAFCSTIGGKTYYFNRHINPGTSAPIGSQSATDDWTSFPRNQAVYSYLQTLTGKAIPGNGNSFIAKYPKDRDQILTEIFDYIRCTNLNDVSLSPTISYTKKSGDQDPTVGPVTHFGQVVPIIPGNGTQGFGRIATISEMALVLVKVDNRYDTTKADTTQAKVPPNLTAGDNVEPSTAAVKTALGYDPKTQTMLEWCLIPDMFCASPGWTALANDLQFKFSNWTLTIGGQQVSSPAAPGVAPGTNKLYDTGRISTGPHDSKIGGNIGFTPFVGDNGRTPVEQQGAPSDSMYPTGLVVVPGSSYPSDPVTSITISGGVTVEIDAPASTNPTKIQTITCSFPSTQVPIPKLAVGANTSTALTQQAWVGTFRASTYTGGATPRFAYNATSTARGNTLYNRTPYGANQTGGNLNQFDYILQGNDTIRSVVPTGAPAYGDMRLIAGAASASFTQLCPKLVGSSYVAPDPKTDYGVHGLRDGVIRPYTSNYGQLAGTTTGYFPAVPSGIVSAVKGTGSSSFAGDWDNGPALMVDGSYINKPDEGHVGDPNNPLTSPAYIGTNLYIANPYTQSPTLFSPNHQISSPVMFGSLPTGVISGTPWQTLLFRPANLLGTTHPGNNGNGPPDHLMLDLFWMPVVEPYPISEPFATSGKINMNTQIAPFTYIKRDTGMRAVMQSVMITALNPNWNGLINKYKAGGNKGASGVDTRRIINLDATMQYMDKFKFSDGSFDIFKSASEICDIPLVPANDSNSGATNVATISTSDSAAAIDAKMATFWQSHQLTGDNSLERPYSQIYPRITTKSNTYTVHVRVQALKKAPSTLVNIWDEKKDQVVSEYRGSTIIERYIDPSDTRLATTNPDTTSVDTLYKWHTVSTKQFGQ